MRTRPGLGFRLRLLVGLLFLPFYIFLFLGAGASAAPPDLGLGTTALLTIGGAAAVFLYEGLMLSSRGQTLGKMAVGIKVVTPEGQEIGAGQAWSRALVRQVFFSYFGRVFQREVGVAPSAYKRGLRPTS